MFRQLSLCALVFATLAGCDHSSAIPVRLTTMESGVNVLEPTENVQDVLDEAFDVWGLEYKLVSGDGEFPRGTLDLTMIPFMASSVHAGYSQRLRPCLVRIWSNYDSSVLAHELGHTFGRLDHHGDVENVMFDTPETTDHTNSQRADVQGGADDFLRCR